MWMVALSFRLRRPGVDTERVGEAPSDLDGDKRPSARDFLSCEAGPSGH